MQTVRHFLPELNDWLDELPDTRDRDALVYPTRFLAWWGLGLSLGQRGSRRQLAFQDDAWGTHVLDNLNRRADTDLSTRPVHDTLDHFLGHVAALAFAQLRTRIGRRRRRMRVLDPARLLGRVVLILDGPGRICWHRRPCDHCLVQKHQKTTLYLHNVLEAQLLGPAGVVLSGGREFIGNAAAAHATGKSTEEGKQDCAWKAFSRLPPQLKKDFPQSRFVVSGDSAFTCGRVLQACQDHEWSYVLTFKPGRLPAVGQEFQSLLPLCPRQALLRERSDGRRQEYRWVHDLSYTDDEGRTWRFHARSCVETSPAGTGTHFAWIPGLPVRAKNVEAIAQKGGRYRWKIEKAGFNRPKNSGLNLAHVYSTDPDKGKAYYYLRQIAFVITQLLERGRLLRQLVEDLGTGGRTVFGSLANLAQQLREARKYCRWPQECFDAQAAARRRVGLDWS